MYKFTCPISIKATILPKKSYEVSYSGPDGMLKHLHKVKENKKSDTTRCESTEYLLVYTCMRTCETKIKVTHEDFIGY